MSRAANDLIENHLKMYCVVSALLCLIVNIIVFLQPHCVDMIFNCNNNCYFCTKLPTASAAERRRTYNVIPE